MARDKGEEMKTRGAVLYEMQQAAPYGESQPYIIKGHKYRPDIVEA
jgi:hypothetical protein